MRLKTLEFGEPARLLEENRVGTFKARVKTLLMISLVVAVTALVVSTAIDTDVEARGDLGHLQNPSGLDQTIAVTQAGLDTSTLNPEATVYLGTQWLQALALCSGLVAFLTAAWLCARTAVPGHDE